MHAIIRFPDHCVGSALHTVWARVPSNYTSKDTTTRKALLDLTNVTFIDAEGLNYLALIPFFLKQSGVNISINLPLKKNVLGFLDTVGLLEQYWDNYQVQSLSNGDFPSYGKAVQLVDVHQRFISRAAHTYIFQ